MFKKLFAIPFIGLLLITTYQPAQAQIEGANHVVVLGVDGLSPLGIQRATTPSFNKVIAEGAFSMHARAVLGTSSSQNWASMIMGAGPEQHGITSNGWERDNYSIEPTTRGIGEIFPTIFSLVRQQRPGDKTAAFYDWGGFGRLFEKKAVDRDVDGDGPENTMEQAIVHLKESQPTFLFIHLDHVDHALHTYGIGSNEYYDAVELTDTLLGQLLDAFVTPGLADETVLLISSDHGGNGTRHGGESMGEMEIPWIAWGPGVKVNYQLSDPINTYDTAATSAFILGLDQPYHWIARPVLSAFEGYENQAKAPAFPPFIPSPRLHPEWGLVEDIGSLTLSVDHDGTRMYYTLDGSAPDKNATPYTGPIDLEGPALVKAIALDDRGGESVIATSQYLSKRNGLTTGYVEGDFEKIPDFSSFEDIVQGEAGYFALSEVSTREDHYALFLEGYIQIDTPGKYTFGILSDDGSKLHLKGALLINNDGAGGARERTATVTLDAGMHAIRAEYFETYGDEAFTVTYAGPGIEKQPIPASRLFKTTE